MDKPEINVDEMKANFIKNAKEKPWSWEWKFTMARVLLSQGRSPQFVRKLLGLTYPWMFRHSLLTRKDGRIVQA